MFARMMSTRTLLAIIVLLALLASPVAPPRDACAWFGDGTAEDAARIARLLELRPGSVVADVGAGDGSYTVELAKIVGPEGHVFATELDQDALEDIREAVADAKLGNVTVVQGAVASTNLPTECCDAVFLRGVYHHLTEPAAIDASVLAALRPGGRFLVIDFPPTIWLSFWTPEGIPADRGGHGVPIEVVEREVESAGFERVRVEPDWDPGLFTDLYAILFRKPAAANAASN
jgi:predicted methyltransferase